MSIIPTIPIITGKGKPRLMLIVETGTEPYTTVGTTTFTSTTMTEAEGSSANISSSSTANPTVITTATNHGLSAGQYVVIAGHTSTPDINGKWKVERIVSVTQFTIAANVTAGGGAAGTVKRTPAFLARGIAPNMRLRSGVVSGSLTETAYARITAVDDTNNILTVDSWVGGTPTGGQIGVIDGWVADLPRCQALKESFTPDQIVHAIYRAKKSVKRYGYSYACTMDYSKYVSGDTLLLLQAMLSPKKNDRLVVVPRVDSPEYQYNVFITNTIELELYGQGLGHRGFQIQLQGTEPLAAFPMISSGYGFGYGQSYGDQL